MTASLAPAKINLAHVVGPLRDDGKHEVATVLQRVSLGDVIEVVPGDGLKVSGFEDDTIVEAALEALAAAVGVDPGWHVEITKHIPVAAGLGGGSSDAAVALRLANELLPEPLAGDRLAALASGIGADVPFFLTNGTQFATGDGTTLALIDLPLDFSILLVMPTGVAKSSTRDVYAAFDARDGAAGFEARRAALRDALATVRDEKDLARLPANDLASSPLSERLLAQGAFRADVTGAGPCVYGLFSTRALAEAAAQRLQPEGRVRVVAPLRSA